MSATTTRPSLAWLWNNELFSDVTVRLYTTQRVTPEGEELAPGALRPSSTGTAAPAPVPPVRARGGKAKVARHAGAVAGDAASAATASALAAAEESDPPARSFTCHANILATSSAYFKTRITDGGGAGGMAYAASSSVSAPSGRQCTKWQLDEHVEEGELVAMESVLCHLYTGALCGPGGEEGAHLGVAQLLQMLVLADRFVAPACLAHCCDELAKRGAEDYGIVDINHVLGGLPGGLHSHASRGVVEANATARMLQLFGDAEAVCTSWFDAGSDLGARLLHLSLPSLLALLSSDALKARSENTVLLLADAWLLQSPAGAACSAAQQRQVAAVVRLGQLTSTFTLDVTRQLPWLQLSGEERESLTQFSCAGLAGGATRQARLVKHEQAVGPPAWYDAKKRVPWGGPADMVLQWDLTQEELTRYLTRAETTDVAASGPRTFYGGFAVAMSLYFKAPPESHVWTGHSAHVYRAGLAEHNLKCRDLATSSSTDCLRGPPPEGGPLPVVTTWSGSMPTTSNSLLVRTSPLAGADVRDPARWLPALTGGKLHVECRMLTCL